MIGEELERYYLNQIEKITDDELVKSLFNKVPSSSIYAFKKTLTYNATKEYYKSNMLLPNNFFAELETELKNGSALRTYKKYEKEFEKMEDFFNIEKKDFVKLLKELITPRNPKDRYKAVESIKNLIRNYNSKYKGHYLKLYNERALKQLKPMCYKKDKGINISSNDLNINYSFLDFIRETKIKNPILYNKLLEYMEDASNIVIDDIIDDVFELINEDANMNEFLNIFGIYKPLNYDKDYIKKCKIKNRIKNNFEPLLNKNEYSEEYKKILVKYINEKVTGSLVNDTYHKISANDKINIEVLFSLLRKMDIKAEIKDNNIILNSDIDINKDKIRRYRIYEEQLSLVEKFINVCKKKWLEEKRKKAYLYIDEDKYLEYDNNHTFDDTNYTINADSYIDYSLISDIINGIDIDKLNNLTETELNSLKSLLNDKDLLFTCLVGNISLEELLLIINNYSSISYYLKKNDFNINDVDNLLRIAKTFTYVNDLEIALIGYDNLVKIINYNQFAGIDVTDDIIKLRIKKAVYLMTKSELLNKSSLPYDISVSKGNLKLERYLNNDPNILVSGVDTKTCFFISVNENDFFFYSLLNKNGFVLKVTDDKDNFIARASCFRRNNILMINGIRLKNNEITPKNKEQRDTMRRIVKLIEMMSEKLIYQTTGDECPIDYVVCNKAGILEGNDFENNYEMIETKLIREPINIYENDWQEFVKINDSTPDMLQECPIDSKTSFTTDFGDNYPMILIKSRNNMGLLRPSDISLKDQSETYERPRIETKIYMPDEIDDNILAKVNRIRALYTFIGTEKRKKPKRENFKLLKKTSNISKIVVSCDWASIVYKDGQKEFAYTNYSDINIDEIQKYASFKETAEFETGKNSNRVLIKKSALK